MYTNWYFTDLLVFDSNKQEILIVKKHKLSHIRNLKNVVSQKTFKVSTKLKVCATVIVSS